MTLYITHGLFDLQTLDSDSLHTIDILLDLFLMLHYCKQTDEWVNVEQYFYHF